MYKYPIALTIDTNVFDAAKYDFSENSTLQLLTKYVKDKKVKVILSNIVVKEAEKHISEQVGKIYQIARNARKKALEESTEYLISYIGMQDLISLKKDKESAINKGIELFREFIKNTQAEILGAELIDIEKIIEDYFEIQPPFEKGEKKRKEFPDAFIAYQIRRRFGTDEDIVIISTDKGLKKACKKADNHFFFDSLGKFYDKLNQEEEVAYHDTFKIAEELKNSINEAILEYIKNYNSIDVQGLRYDKDGIESGFDYSECELNHVSNITSIVDSVDELGDESSLIVLSCTASISADCYYEDYENAVWDSETKNYFFVDTIHVREKHSACFTCRMKLNRIERTFELLPFIVMLDEDTRDEYEILEESEFDDEDEIVNMDRENLGFHAFGDYDEYLENNLSESNMQKEIVERFEEINNIYKNFENVAYDYDDLLEKIYNIDDHIPQIKTLEKEEQSGKVLIPITDENIIYETAIDAYKCYIESLIDGVDQISNTEMLPDFFTYGSSIEIKGFEDSTIRFTIDEIKINPSAGEEEIIEVYLTKDDKKIAEGYVKLTVGYLNFDEDGGVADGIGDDIEYEYSSILEKIDVFISEQKEKVETQKKLVATIKKALHDIGEANSLYRELM